jgi:Amt family ammonium transporter
VVRECGGGVPHAPGYRTGPGRSSEEQQQTGLDLTAHAETAYDHGVPGHGAPVSSSVVPHAQKVTPQA